METAIVAIIFVVQIALAVWMWNLYQNSKRDLNARIAEAPMLLEVHNLQRTVKELLTAIEDASQDTTARLEVRCAEARFLLGTLEGRLSEVEVQEVLASSEQKPQEAITANTAELLVYEARSQDVASIDRDVASPFTELQDVENVMEEDRETLYQRAYALA